MVTFKDSVAIILGTDGVKMECVNIRIISGTLLSVEGKQVDEINKPQATTNLQTVVP